MSSHMKFASKTQHYQKVQKPLLERKRRARINKCLDALKEMMAEFQGNEEILRMDKAEMLESTIAFMRTKRSMKPTAVIPVDSFKHGYMNAVNEVSRVLASTPGMSVELGKSVMTHLGRVYNRLEQQHNEAEQTQQQQQQQFQQHMKPLTIDCMAPLSPASSGYHSDMESPAASPVAVNLSTAKVWRPW